MTACNDTLSHPGEAFTLPSSAVFQKIHRERENEKIKYESVSFEKVIP